MSGAIPNPKHTPPVRRPVGVSVTEWDTLVACDDGTVWYWDEGMWAQFLCPIPGTLADQQARGAEYWQTDRQEAYERLGGTVAALRQALIGDARSPLVDDLSQAIAALVTHMERRS